MSRGQSPTRQKQEPKHHSTKGQHESVAGLETRPTEWWAATTEEQGENGGEKYSHHPRSRNLLVSAWPQPALGHHLTTSTDAAPLEHGG